MKFGHRLPAASEQVFNMAANGAELSEQTAVAFGLSGKKFCRTSDLVFVSIGDDSARFGHEPEISPPFPSNQIHHN